MIKLATIAAVLAVAVAAPAFAQSQAYLDNQIGAVGAVQYQNWQAQSAAQAAEQAAEDRAAHRAWVARRAAASAAQAAAQERFAAAQADKKRDQSYQDRLRDIQVQEEETQLDMDKAKAARANAYIDQDLNRQKAETDVVQSGADANRDVASGVKNYLSNSAEPSIVVVNPGS